MERGEVTIVGEIKFANDPPKGPLPKPSQLSVKLQDCMRADAAAIDIGQVDVDGHLEYSEGQPLKYSLKVANFLFGMDYSVSKFPIYL